MFEPLGTPFHATSFKGIKEKFSPYALNLEFSSDFEGYSVHQPNEGLMQEPCDNTAIPHSASCILHICIS